MPDWKKEIARRLSELNLPPAREAEIVEELAQHLDDVYEQEIQSGSTKEQAHQAALRELADSDLLAQELYRVPLKAQYQSVVLGEESSWPVTSRHGVLLRLIQWLRYGMSDLCTRESRGLCQKIVAFGKTSCLACC